jgi:hypothetical protein
VYPEGFICRTFCGQKKNGEQWKFAHEDLRVCVHELSNLCIVFVN